MKHRHWAVLLPLSALALIAGCRATTPAEEPSAPTPEEVLRGTWRNVRNLDGSEVTQLLTLTKSRFIYQATGLSRPTVVSGKWSANEDVIAATIASNAGTFIEDEMAYSLDENGHLNVEAWINAVEDTVHVYERVPPLVSSDLHGIWRAFGRQARNDGSQHVTADLRIGEECSYRREYRDEDDDVEPRYFIDAIGPCEVDLAELRVAFVVSRVDTDPKSSWGVVGNTLTFAIAPTAEDATSIRVSGFWNEQTYNRDTGEWELGNADFPYGQYDFLMRRVDQ